MTRVFFDNAATTPIHPDVVQVISKSLSDTYGNPSSSHSFGREAKGQLEESRRTIAKLLGAKPSEIFFTSCGTESNNAILRNAINSDKISEIWTTPIEHPSVYQTSNQICKDIPVRFLDLKTNGSVDLDKLEIELSKTSKNVLISVMHANNEVGVLNDLKSIGDLCQKYHALLHSDMVQTMGHLPINFQEIKVDFASASAHKFHGPKGVGFMYIRQPNQIHSLITGGSQERGYRSGTENLASIAGMAKAFELASQNLETDIVYLNKLRTAFMTKLKLSFPTIDFLTKIDESLCTIVSTIFPSDFDSEMLLFQLDMKGVACSGGSACSSGAAKASHVLTHFKLPEACKVVRFSFSKFNTEEEIDFCIEKIKEIANERVQTC